MPAPSAVTWATLADIPTVASCMPGAKITERIDDAHYKGTVTVKVGPATLAFKGEIEVQALDAVKRTIRLVAKGTDSSGSSAAALDLTAKVQDADAGRSELVGHSEASVSGQKAAAGQPRRGQPNPPHRDPPEAGRPFRLRAPHRARIPLQA